MLKALNPTIPESTPLNWLTDMVSQWYRCAGAYSGDKPFDSLEEARKWVSSFTGWYNEAHRHSAIKFVTPSQRHSGKDLEILNRRERIDQEAQKKNPERWPGKTRDWTPIGKVTLNPQKEVASNDPSLKEEKSKKMRQIA